MGFRLNIISIFFPPEIGAAPSRIFKLTNALRNSGMDIEVLTALPNYPKGEIFKAYKNKFFVKESIKNITTRRFWLYPSTSKNAFLRIISMFSFSISIFFSMTYLLKRRPNVIIINSPPLLVGFSAVLLTKLCNSKILLNVSDLWPLSALELGAIRRGWFYNFLEWVEKFIYRKSDAIMAQSEESLIHIRKLVDKPTFLYRNMDAPSSFLKKFPNYSDRHIKIVYAGLLGVAQGVLSICQNIDFASLDVELHIYGSGNEYNAIHEYIENTPDSKIYLHDTIAKELVPEMLSNYHATLIPLSKPIYGAFPSKIFMATASGLPILFSGEGEGANFVKDYKLGWISKSGDYISLKANIKELKSMGYENYLALRNNCIDKCLNVFNEEKQNKLFLEFIHEHYGN